jgi:hypothetical protein
MSDTYIVNVGPQSSTSDTDSSNSSSTSPSSSGGINSENAGLLQQVMDNAWSDGEFDENDLAAMNALLGTPTTDDSSSPSGASSTDEKKDKMTDAEFLSAVNDIANQSDPGMGPGEKMMLDEANRLIENGGTSKDKQAFVDEATKLLNNEDGNGDGPQDIDQSNDKEGTMLHDLTTALLADNEKTDGSDGSDSFEGSSTDANAMISDFIDKAYADNTLSDTELQGLQALLGATAASEPSNASSTDDTQTASSSYTYDDLVTQMIMGDMEQDGINDVSGNLALSYVTEEEGEDA